MNFKILAIFAFILTGIISCKKEGDPDPIDLEDQLTNPFCNDPRAINYNWGFPGKADSTVCQFPVDSFLGNWIFTDSVFYEDETFSEVVIRNLQFFSTEDTLLQHMEVHGWCMNNNIIYLTADRFNNALLDDLIENHGGQLGCSSEDTLSGHFNKNFIGNDSMRITVSEKGAEGTKNHRGLAIRSQ